MTLEATVPPSTDRVPAVLVLLDGRCAITGLDIATGLRSDLNSRQTHDRCRASG
jgi:hypothetical protein